MKKIIITGVLAVLTMCASNGFGQDSTQDSTKPNGKTQMSNSKNADGKFMSMAATSGMNEITLSNQALSKSSNEDVKKFAQMMIDDHTKAGDELKSLAMTKNIMLPTDADAKHKAALTKMSSLTGDSFDMAYVKMMVKDHEKAVALFQKESTGGKDEDAKAFAAKTLPTLQGHLEMARSMMSKMMGGKTADKMKGM